MNIRSSPAPDGLTQAFILGEVFIGNDDVCLVLGDNIFYGVGLFKKLQNAVETIQEKDKADVFGYQVHDPEKKASN